MKPLSVIPLLFFTWGMTSSAATLAPEKQTAYETVKNAPVFSIGGVGIAGIPSKAEESLSVLMKEENAVELLKNLLKEATTEGRMYALYGLKSVDKEAFEKCVQPFLEMENQVTTQSGCIVRQQKVSEVVKAIQRGDYSRSFFPPSE